MVYSLHLLPVGSKGPLSYSMKHDYRGTSATWNLEDPMFPGPRISVLGVSAFFKGCDLKLFKEPSTFGKAFLVVHHQSFRLGYHHETLVCRLKLSFYLMHLWIRMKH